MFIQENFFGGEPLETVYFGGGSPSLVPVQHLAALLAKAEEIFGIKTGAEITIEANPDDMQPLALRDWRKAGFNRLSMGVQSFFDNDLAWMNRAHDARQAIDALRSAGEVFENITADLIYGLPTLSDQHWEINMDRMVEAGIPHLSCYALTVEPKTPLEKNIRAGKSRDIDPAQQARQFLRAIDRLEKAGYEHYEISSFAKPGFQSRHNSSYWQGKKYLGLGPSAHSYDGENRSWNVSNNQLYMASIEKGILPAELETLTPRQRENEYIMTSLRTSLGLDLNRVSEQERVRLLHESKKFLEEGKMIIEKDRLVLTREGKLFADGIASELFG